MLQALVRNRWPVVAVPLMMVLGAMVMWMLIGLGTAAADIIDIGPIEPDSDINPVGSSHTVTVTVTGVNPDGENFMTLVFDIPEGPNDGIPSAGAGPTGVLRGSIIFDNITHNVTGDGVFTSGFHCECEGNFFELTFTYTDSGGAGEDIIRASDSDDATLFVTGSKVWVDRYVTGGGNVKTGPKGKKNKDPEEDKFWTFGGTVGLADDLILHGNFQVQNHLKPEKVHFNVFGPLCFSTPGGGVNVATFGATGSATGSFGSKVVHAQIKITDGGGKGKKQG